MTEEVPERFVVVTKANSGDSEHVRAVVHPNEDSANEYLAELKAATPWQDHSVVPFDQFANPAAPADETGKDGHF